MVFLSCSNLGCFEASNQDVCLRLARWCSTLRRENGAILVADPDGFWNAHGSHLVIPSHWWLHIIPSRLEYGGV
jgi:hypothetical protein